MSVDFDPLYKWLGIPPSEQPPNCYRLLGLEAFEDDLDVIENAADRQVAFLRGFQSGPHAAIAEEVINQVRVARSWLLQPERKAQYDAWLREKLRATSSPPLPANEPTPPFPPVSVSTPAQEISPNLEEILGDLESYVLPAHKSRRGLRQQKIGVAIYVGAAVFAMAALAVVVWMVHQSWSPEGTLEVDWPEEERGEGTLLVEGKPVDVPSVGRIRVSVPGGARQVSVMRPGYKAYELTVSVTPRKTTVVRPVWRPLGEDDAQKDSAEVKAAGDSQNDKSADKHPSAKSPGKGENQIHTHETPERVGQKNPSKDNP